MPRRSFPVRSHRALLACMLLPATLFAPSPTLAADEASRIQLPPGFTMETVADGLASPRQIVLGAQGTLFVGSLSGAVWALRDEDEDGRYERRFTLLDHLNLPAGVAFHQGDLYVSAVSRILRLPDIETQLGSPHSEVVTERLPDDRHHGLRHIAFGPDGRLYIPIGVPCNVCESPAHGRIISMDPSGEGWRIEAVGIRNSVGMDWQPGSARLWFSDNGRDWLGDDSPSDELNRIDQQGQHFGFPFCHARGIADPEFGEEGDCSRYAAPIAELGAHVAPLGVHFYRGSAFPSAYRNALFIAEHGSWNRSRKVGYRLVVFRFDGGRISEPEVFASGWLQGEEVSGRPVAITETAAGELLLSDDLGGRIYRIRYHAPAAEPAAARASDATPTAASDAPRVWAIPPQHGEPR